MNTLIQHFMKLSDPEQIFNIAEANFKDLSFYVFSRDLKGKYLFGNLSMANLAGFTTGNELRNLTDFDLPWSEGESIARENDARVIAERKMLSFIERGTGHTGKHYRYATLKAPIRGKHKNTIGIICIAFILEEIKPISALFPQLSRQQIKCLYHLVQGLTMKQIAQMMRLSPKTVEHYLDTVKIKMNCNSRAELISHAISLGILQNSEFS